MKNIARILLALAAAAIFVSPLVAAEQGQQRYIVVIRRQRFGPPPTPDVVRLGGTIESRQDDQLVVTIPAGALAALKGDPSVLYVERVGGTPDGDGSPLIGEPADPQPGAQAKRFIPHALGTISWDSGNYAYDGAGNIVSIGSDNYLYDGVQRLKQSSTQGSVESYTYDGFGNMRTKTNTAIPNVQPATNRYEGYTYNEVGAVKTDGLYEFTYDALGQPLSKKYNNDVATQEYYIYTANDERIGVERNNWWTWSVRDEGGKVLRQYKSSATNTSSPALWLEDFVWRDGLLLGSQRPVEMGGRRHFHLDHLGTPRLITSDSGQMVSYHDYYPFGDEHSPVQQEHPSGFDREDPMKFTGHERDYAGGMGVEDGHAVDYMHARYYNPTAGRFLSVDPTWDSADIGRPQAWNRYSYALNNPVRYTDPDGRCTAAVVDCVLEGGAVAGPVGAVIGAAAGVGIIAVGTKINWSAVGDFLANAGMNDSGGSGGERFAEKWIRQNNANHMAEKQDEAKPTTDPKRRFSKEDRQAGLDKSKDAQGTPRCEHCGKELNPKSGSGNSYEADHRDPHAQGGQSTQDNLAPSCRDCNREKGNRTPDQWKKDKEKDQQ